MRCQAETLLGKPCQGRIAARYIKSHGTVYDCCANAVAVICSNHMAALSRGRGVTLRHGKTLQMVDGILMQTTVGGQNDGA